MFLELLGADAAVHRLFQPYAARGLLLARVAVSQRDHYQLFTTAGELPAEASGALRYRTPDRADMPVTGDWVATRVVNPFQAIVEAVLPRKTVFSRTKLSMLPGKYGRACAIWRAFAGGAFSLCRSDASSKSGGLSKTFHGSYAHGAGDRAGYGHPCRVSSFVLVSPRLLRDIEPNRKMECEWKHQCTTFAWLAVDRVEELLPTSSPRPA
jgi:hypothetical protein